MKDVINLAWVPPIALVLAISAAAYADNKPRSPASAGGVQARGDIRSKLEYCKTCHGSSAQGYRGSLIMPRLAGQTPEYVTNQLQAFVDHRRQRDLSINMARTHKVPMEMQAELANHFKDLHAGPSADAPKRLVDTGRKIYDEGVAEDEIPACSSCHGSAAEGKDVSPRLAGQSYRYTVKELAAWSVQRGQGTEQGAPKKKAHTLSKSQIEAVAAYVSYLP